MNLLSTTELAKLVIQRYPNRKLQTVRSAIKRDIVAGRLVAEKIGNGWVITADHAEAWIAGRQDTVGRPPAGEP